MARTIEKQLQTLEKKLRATEARLADLKRQWGQGAVKDYTLAGPGGRKVKLSSAFGRQQWMVLVHNMGQSCPYCTLWADGFNSLWQHIERGIAGQTKRAACVVVSPDEPAAQARFARSRKWGFRMLSAAGTTLFRDLGYADENNRPWPGVSILRRQGRKITRHARDFFGPGDKYNPIFSFFELMA